MAIADTLTLGSHALAALLFGVLAVWALRSNFRAVPRLPFLAALALTGLWALAVAGVGEDTTIALAMQAARDLAWLLLLALLHHRGASNRTPITLPIVYGAVAGVEVLGLVLRIIAATPAGRELFEPLTLASYLLGMMSGVATLALINYLYSLAGRTVRDILLALGAIWMCRTGLLAIAYLNADWHPAFGAVRGLVFALAAAPIALAIHRPGASAVRVSRTVAYQSLSLAGITLYLLGLLVATSALAAIGGEHARLLQTAFVFGSTAMVLTLASTPWLRAWVRVKIAKHLFRHRYDYRSEWMRFTGTLGEPGGGAPLDQRVVKAIADLVDATSGVLLVPDGDGLGQGAQWDWDGGDLPVAPTDRALAQHLTETGRIIELDAVRAGNTEARDLKVVPQWMLDLPEAWILVPLPHFDQLAGVILLGRPPVDRALDWEDFDLLRVAGRQVASYLAEARAHDALTEAQRFEEFNRRFAFILHDIKNLVSQLTLVARNAERHADNPEFRADMVATLRDSAGRMNDLLARLSQHHRGPAAPLRAVRIATVADKIVTTRKSQHPVIVSGDRRLAAMADPARLQQLLSHLVQNAIEASAALEPVTIAIDTAGDRVAIDVIDQGCGMSPAFIRDQLFKPFASSKAGGFGIGAFEARQLAQAMGGRLTVTSREGHGTRFRVTLSLAHARAEKTEKAA